MGYIYKISNCINNYLYIGKTVTTIEHRWNQHKNAYMNYDWQLYQAMRNIGFDQFHIDCIEECNDEIINERETYWIKYYDTYKNGYNMTEGGDGRIQINRVYVKEHWEAGESVKTIASALEVWSSSIVNILKQLDIYDMQEVRKRALIDIANTQSSGLIYCYSDGYLIATYNSIKEASEITGEKSSSIKNSIYNKTGLHGKLWSKEKLSINNFRTIKIQKNAEIEQYTLSGEYIKTYKTASEAGRAIGGDASGIIKVCRGKRKTYRQYIWKYKE